AARRARYLAAAAGRGAGCPLSDRRLSGTRRIQSQPAPGVADRGVFRGGGGGRVLHRTVSAARFGQRDRLSCFPGRAAAPTLAVASAADQSDVGLDGASMLERSPRISAFWA